MSNKEIPVVIPKEVICTYRHKKTGQTFKDRKDWETKGFKEE